MGTRAQPNFTLAHSHTATLHTATIQNHYIEFQPSGEWWSFNFQWTSFLSSISTLSLSLCSWLRFSLNWLLVITYWWWWWVLIRHSFSHPLQTSVHISGPGVLAMGAALVTWPPETTARFKPAPITKILWSKNTTTEYISLTTAIICLNSFLILVSKDEHLYCSFMRVLFPWVLEFNIQRWNRCVSVCMYLGRDLSWGLEDLCRFIPQKSINDMKKKTLFKHRWP